MYLEIKDVKKSYGKDAGYVQVLKGVSTGVEKGQMCVIQGTSGSGKSTLLNCIGGLDTMDSGSVRVDGNPMHWQTTGVTIWALSSSSITLCRILPSGRTFRSASIFPTILLI